MITNISNMSDFLDNEMKEQIIGKYLEEMILETGCFPNRKPLDAIIENYWFNVYEKGDNQEMHQHLALPSSINGHKYEVVFSLVYILNSEEENSILFKLPEPFIPFFPVLELCQFDTRSVKEIKEGTLLIFSNQLSHAVLPIKKSGRTTIAFNVSCRFE
jgi:hypothetical protein